MGILKKHIRLVTPLYLWEDRVAFFKRGLPSLLLALSVFWGGCSWTPQVETVLFDGPQGFVSLRTLPEGMLRASHPIDIPEAVLARTLRGISTKKKFRLLQNLLTGGSQEKQTFSMNQVKILAPQLAGALSKATPEELVYFRSPTTSTGDSPFIEGTLLVHGSSLLFSWSDQHTKTQELPKQGRPPILSAADPADLQSSTVLFTPKEAQRDDALLAGTGSNVFQQHVVAIDFHRLAGLPVQPSEYSGDAGGHAEKSSEKSENSMEFPQPDVFPTVQTGGNKTNDGMQELQKQMKDLKKEMKKQQQEIQRLQREGK